MDKLDKCYLALATICSVILFATTTILGAGLIDQVIGASVGFFFGGFIAIPIFGSGDEEGNTCQKS